MIPCEKCGNANPLSTKYCRRCGEKLTVSYTEVARSVAETHKTDAERRWLEHGRGYIGIALFLCLCALLARCVLAPPLPPADLTPAPPEELLTDALPAPGKAAATAVAAEAPPRLVWRRAQAPRLAAECGLEPAVLARLLQPIVAAQQADGLWAAPDPLAASGLALLALQAYPVDEAVWKAVERGRAALRARELATQAPTGRALAAAALADAGQLPPALVNALLVPPADAAAAPLTALGWLALPAPRPAARELTAVLPGAGWAWVMAGGAPPAPVDLRNVRLEERLGWALAAWRAGIDPDGLMQALVTWHRTPPTTDALVPWAGAAHQVLLVTVPLREPVTP